MKIDKTLFKDIRLLYVEDDAMTLEEISFFLKKYVKELIVAKNGEEGLELFKKHRPDMVITDIQMPVMDGLQMSEKIFEIDPSIPIAVTTAYSDGQFIMKAIELGIDKYIIKPINMSEILAVIQKSLNLQKNLEVEGECEDYIQFILDSNPTFMFIMHSDKIEYANKKFLELLGHDNIKSLKEQSKSCEDLFEFDEVNTQKNWIDYIIENSDKTHLVHLKKEESSYYFKSKFYVSYRYFESKNKSVFVFVDTNEDKLNKINNITKNLINEKNLNEEILRNLNEILKISKRD